MEKEKYIKGRGAQLDPINKYNQIHYADDGEEPIDERLRENQKTQVLIESAKTIVNKVDSPDLFFCYSTNPYQGCEHGCSYCYARPTHEYYGFGAGLDFESKIFVKKNAPELLEKFLNQPTWTPSVIIMSGNTDCYQPLERKHKITRAMLQVFFKYRNPVALITKNKLILRDIDVLHELAQRRLTRVMISITTLEEDLRRRMEPRTASVAERLRTIHLLAQQNIPVGVMMAPVIPGLNDHEIPSVLREASHQGAQTAGMTVLRLNGPVQPVFMDWLETNYPHHVHKVKDQMQSMHAGKMSNYRYGDRFRGSGHYAEAIEQLFRAAKKKYFSTQSIPPFNLTAFRRYGIKDLFESEEA